MKDNLIQERQVYKTLSICVKFIKSDVNLKVRLKVSSNVIYGRRFQRVEYQSCSKCLCHSNIRLLENLIQFTIKTRNGKSYWSAKIWYKRVLCPNFFKVFRHWQPVGLH